MFFSPHQCMHLELKAKIVQKSAIFLGIKIDIDPSHYKYVQTKPSVSDFKRSITKMSTICDFLKVNGKIVKPDFICRQEILENHFKSLLKIMGLSSDITLAKKNVSKASSEETRKALNSEELRLACLEKFSEDYNLLKI